MICSSSIKLTSQLIKLLNIIMYYLYSISIYWGEHTIYVRRWIFREKLDKKNILLREIKHLIEINTNDSVRD